MGEVAIVKVIFHFTWGEDATEDSCGPGILWLILPRGLFRGDAFFLLFI